MIQIHGIYVYMCIIYIQFIVQMFRGEIKETVITRGGKLDTVM